MAGRWKAEILSASGARHPAVFREVDGGRLAPQADGSFEIPAGPYEVFVPDSAATGRIRLTPVRVADDGLPGPWAWRPSETDDGSLWFELPRRVVVGVTAVGSGIRPGSVVTLKWMDTGERIGTLTSGMFGEYGMNLPAGEGAERTRDREVSWSAVTTDGSKTGGTQGEEVAGTVVVPPGQTSRAYGVINFTSPGPLAVPVPTAFPCVGVYPNPWRPNAPTTSSCFVVFFGLKKQDGIDIFTITGERVRTLGGQFEQGVVANYAIDPRFPSSAGYLSFWGYVLWDGRNDRGKEVADGVYIFAINLRSHTCWDGKSRIMGRLTIIR